MSQLDSIKEMLGAYDDGKVILDECVRVKLTPHQPPFNVWGAWLGPDGVYLMDGEGNWHGPLEESQINGKQVISSLYQRLKLLSYAGGITN